jgi:hypothetical protein
MSCVDSYPCGLTSRWSVFSSEWEGRVELVSRSDMLEPSEGENATEVFQEAGRQKSVSTLQAHVGVLE